MDFAKHFDVIIVGGGHAGTEAAMASARTGAQTLLLTQSVDTIGQMSCNPAIGGLGKGHLVKEIDALGGVMAKAIDRAGIQFRILNASKGPAVQATRAQADRVLYKEAIRDLMDRQANLTLFQQPVEDLILNGEEVAGVVTQMGLRFFAPCVVLTTGTFLDGLIHIGASQARGGRAGCASSIALAKRLRELPFPVGRLKTGTPPRIDGRTVDFSVLGVQHGDTPMPVFSYMGKVSDHPRQVPCYIAATNERTHEIIRNAFDRSPLFTGVIEGVGPRYCPSVEDKVSRFASRTSHQVFIEPEGLTSSELYPNGLSTSLPFDVQIQFIQSMKGFERAHIVRPGYAIEYDYFDPQALTRSLETPFISGLFFAGQINGTTGYEEAAAQGLIAGLNAARKSKGLSSWTPGRSESYIGVMIDDLITQGTQEPYRMFTSRAEYRLMLREDNADVRLTPKGRELGLVDDERWAHFEEKQNEKDRVTAALRALKVHPQNDLGRRAQAYFDKPMRYDQSLYELIRRPEIEAHHVRDIAQDAFTCDTPMLDQVMIEIKYEGYIARQAVEVALLKKQEAIVIPADFNFKTLSGLSNELVDKLGRIRPNTLGLAMQIPGMTPAAMGLLAVSIKAHGHADREIVKECNEEVEDLNHVTE